MAPKSAGSGPRPMMLMHHDDAEREWAYDRQSEVGGPQKWRVYPVSADLLGTQRYVVEISGSAIAGISKVQRDASGRIYPSRRVP